MRRAYLSPALESFNGPELGNANISMEEEAIMLDEAGQAAAEVSQDLNEAERVIQVSDALEALAEAAGSGDEELSPKEAKAMEAAGDMAVAGTDIDPEEIVPAMESFSDGSKISGRLAMEDFKEKARTLWENIKRMLKEIWEKITTFFYNIFGTVPRLQKSLKSLRDKVEAAQSKSRENAKFSIGTTRHLFIGGTAAKSGDAYASGMDDLLKSAEYVYGGYVDTLKAIGGDIAHALETFDAEKPSEATAKLASDIVKRGPAVPGASGAGGSRWPKYEVKKGHDLPGGVALFSLRAKETDKTGDLGTLELARQANLVLDNSSEKAITTAGSTEFTTLSLTDAEKLIAVSEKILEKMEAYQRGKAKKEIQETKDKIASASNKAESAAGKAKGGSAEEQAAVPHYRALINFNLAYARWVQSPTIPFTKNALGAIRTAMTLVERSLSQYK